MLLPNLLFGVRSAKLFSSFHPECCAINLSTSDSKMSTTYLGNLLLAIIVSGVGGVKVVGTVQAKNQLRPKGAAMANTTQRTLSSLSPLLSLLNLTADYSPGGHLEFIECSSCRRRRSSSLAHFLLHYSYKGTSAKQAPN